jgi:hypothetical protein
MAPHFTLENRTLVLDMTTGEQLMWIEGNLPLPVGSRIRVTDLGNHEGTWDAIVQQVGTVAVGARDESAEANGKIAVQLDVILEQPTGSTSVL